MKKQIVAALTAVLLSVPAFAQFEAGTNYVNASLSGMSLSYSHDTKWDLGLDAKVGRFVADEWMLHANFNYGFQYLKSSSNVNNFQLGVGTRYYIKQNGLSLGASIQYEHRTGGEGTPYAVLATDKNGNVTGAELRRDPASKYNSLAICPEVAYTFFINQYLTIEPSLYYNLSLNDFANYSRVGFRIGIGYYFKSKSKQQPHLAQ